MTCIKYALKISRRVLTPPVTIRCCAKAREPPNIKQNKRGNFWCLKLCVKNFSIGLGIFLINLSSWARLVPSKLIGSSKKQRWQNQQLRGVFLKKMPKTRIFNRFKDLKKINPAKVKETIMVWLGCYLNLEVSTRYSFLNLI